MGGMREVSEQTTGHGGCQSWGPHQSCEPRTMEQLSQSPPRDPEFGAAPTSCFPPGLRRRPGLHRWPARACSGLLSCSGNSGKQEITAGTNLTLPWSLAGPNKQYNNGVVCSQATGSSAGLQRKVRPCLSSDCSRQQVAGSGGG